MRIKVTAATTIRPSPNARSTTGPVASAWPSISGSTSSILHFGEGLGAQLVPPFAEPDVLNYSWRDYGNRVGAWRMLELFDTLNFPASVLINTALYDNCPELVAAFRNRGDEIVGHGRTNSERQGSLDEEAERALIAEVDRRVLRRRKGARRPGGSARGFPRAWSRPTFSPRPAIRTCSIGGWTTSRST